MYQISKLPGGFAPAEPADAGWRQTLLQMADYIERCGWCQNRMESPNGQVCLVGAWWKVTGEPMFQAGTLIPLADRMGASEEGQVLSRTIGATKFATWNDSRDRTEEQVLSMLRLAANAARVSA